MLPLVNNWVFQKKSMGKYPSFSGFCGFFKEITKKVIYVVHKDVATVAVTLHTLVQRRDKFIVDFKQLWPYASYIGFIAVTWFLARYNPS